MPFIKLGSKELNFFIIPKLYMIIIKPITDNVTIVHAKEIQKTPFVSIRYFNIVNFSYL